MGNKGGRAFPVHGVLEKMHAPRMIDVELEIHNSGTKKQKTSAIGI
jgi:hypothetical protein